MNHETIQSWRVSQNEERYTTEMTRWYILAVFSLANMNQCLTWFTFSSVSLDNMESFFGSKSNEDPFWMPGINKSTIGWLLNWGPIIGVLVFPLQAWLTQKKNGWYTCVVVAITLTCFGNIIRTIPILFGPHGRDTQAAFICYHFGQILNAAAGPFVMSVVTKLSCVWFAENERVFATGIAVTSNGVGNAVGFLAGPYFCDGNIETLFMLCLILSCIPVLCVLVFFPILPREFPSEVARQSAINPNPNLNRLHNRGSRKQSSQISNVLDSQFEGDEHLLDNFEEPSDSIFDMASPVRNQRIEETLEETLTDTVNPNPNSFWNCLRFSFPSTQKKGVVSYLVLVITTGIVSGVCCAWQGLLQVILNPAGINEKTVVRLF